MDATIKGGTIKDGASEAQAHGRPCICLNLSNVVALFGSDYYYKTLMESLRSNKQYFKDLSVQEAIKEILWWIYRCNIGCRESGLVHKEDFEVFALYLYVTNVMSS